MFVRHPRSVFMLRTHSIKHSFEFPPHFLVIHTLSDHNTSYLITPFFSDLTELFRTSTQLVNVVFNNSAYAYTDYTPTPMDGYTCVGVVGFAVQSANTWPLQITKTRAYLSSPSARTTTVRVDIVLLYAKNHTS